MEKNKGIFCRIMACCLLLIHLGSTVACGRKTEGTNSFSGVSSAPGSTTSGKESLESIKSVEGDKVLYFHDQELLEDEEVVVRATHVVDAVYIGKNSGSSLNDDIFQVKTIYKGQVDTVDEAELHVLLTEELPEGANLVAGQTYNLCIEKNISVYYDYNHYVQIGRIVSETDAEDWKNYHEMINNAMKNVQMTSPMEYGVPYADSALPIENIIDFSSSIFIVEIKGVYAESQIQETTVYYCTVKKTAKNEPANGGGILITLFNNTVDVGEEYLVLLADATETAPIYTLSTKSKSVFSLEEANCIAELNNICNEAKEYQATNLEAEFTLKNDDN